MNATEDRVAAIERELRDHKGGVSHELERMRGELTVLERNDRNAAEAFEGLREEVVAIKADVAGVKSDVRVMASEVKAGLSALGVQMGHLSDNVQIPAKYLWPLLVAVFGGSILGAGGAREALGIEHTPPAAVAPAAP